MDKRIFGFMVHFVSQCNRLLNSKFISCVSVKPPKAFLNLLWKVSLARLIRSTVLSWTVTTQRERVSRSSYRPRLTSSCRWSPPTICSVVWMCALNPAQLGPVALSDRTGKAKVNFDHFNGITIAVVGSSKNKLKPQSPLF